jgi:2-C-methyl-D-erythritol 4-phosphate cytidylyltransferase
MKSVAIILSGGVGSRFGGILPKQFTKLAGRTVIEYTVQSFEDSLFIDEIIIVSKNEFIEKTWDIVKKNSWRKVTKVITGGKERFDSTLSALKSMVDYPSDTKTIFHDAVRPFVGGKIIEDCIYKLDLFDVVDVVIPSSDTIVEIYDDGCIANIPNRSNIRRGQTPQAFKLSIIRDAYKKALAQNNMTFTCDCGVVRAMLPHVKVATIEGSDRNIKITHSIDLFLAEKLIQTSDKTNIETHSNLDGLNGKNIVIFGGTSGIGQEMGNIAKLCGANVFVASRKYNSVDITKKGDVVSFLDSISKSVKTIDAIINTAGLLIKKPLELLSDNEVKSLIDINYLGVVNVAMASKPYLEKSNIGGGGGWRHAAQLLLKFIYKR